MTFADFFLPGITALIAALSLGVDLKTRRGKFLGGLLALFLIVACFAQSCSNSEARSERDSLNANLDQIRAQNESQLSALASQSDVLEKLHRLVKEGFGNNNPEINLQELSTSLEANRLRMEIAREAAPDALRFYSVQYFPKDVDGNVVLQELRGLGFEVTTGSPGVPDLATNFIACGEDVPLSAVKLVAATLIRAGVEIRHIRRFRNSDGRSRLIQVGAGTSHVRKPPIGIDELSAANGLPIRDPEI